MKKTHVHNPDIVVLYQDLESVKEAVKQIQTLDVNIHSLVLGENCIEDLIVLQPKVILISSNNVSRSIKFYVEFLEKNEKNISRHIAVLLIRNKESQKAFIACENGLFDNYAIINPLNEPNRLNLVLLQALKLIEISNNDSIKQLVSEGEEELAACLEQGALLKQSLKKDIIHCEKTITESTNKLDESDEASLLLHRVVETTFNELNENISCQIQNILDQLIDVNKINNTISSKISAQSIDVSDRLLNITTLNNLPTHSNELEHKTQKHYKLLIAEHSDLIAKLLMDIFEKTEFEAVLSKDGIDALHQFKSFQPDIILSAYNLPKINGIEMTHRIRGSGSKVPIIAFSHNKDKAIINKWVLQGINAYIVKPSSQGVIYKAVKDEVNKVKDILECSSEHVAEDIVWKNEFSVGNELMDEQHQVLFSLINDFFHADSKQKVLTIFNSLSEYVEVHFSEEESLMKEVNYPKFSAHVKQHKILRDKLKLLRGKLGDFDPVSYNRIGIFLYSWLAKHILKSDMDYKKFVEENIKKIKSEMNFFI